VLSKKSDNYFAYAVISGYPFNAKKPQNGWHFEA